MKDNLPNYLNPHNIDPSRIEPAHIDTPPGNDSIRPGMNKCGMLNAECEMREGAPFDEYGTQIALAGGDWSKGIQDHAERNGPFLSDSRLRHFVRHEQPPTMSNAEAIEVLKHIETDIYGRIAIGKAIDALSSPWVKTADRMPTEADADNTMCWVLATTISSNLPMPEAIAYIRANPDNYPYWMPIQPLPEVEK